MSTHKTNDGIGKFSVKIIEVDPTRRRPRSCMYFANPFAAKIVHERYANRGTVLGNKAFTIVNEEGTELVPLDSSRHFYSWSYAEIIRNAYRKIYDSLVESHNV